MGIFSSSMFSIFYQNSNFMAQILSGPAVRRTLDTQINIWIALDSQPSSVTAHVKTALKGNAIGEASPASCQAVQMGENLFLYLLKIVPVSGDSFPAGKKLYYDIEIDGNNLQALGLTAGEKRITYADEQLPSLVIPDKHTLILQASCRKPHAELEENKGQRDQMLRADWLLEEHFKSKKERPTMMVLMGDQIYGDDVASPMIAALRLEAKKLMGVDEEMPDLRGRARKIVPATLELGGRGRTILSKAIGFTTSEDGNHLMGIGEYFAMYFAVWGGIELKLLTWSEAKKSMGIAVKPVPSPDGRRMENREIVTKSGYESERHRIEKFLSEVWRVRRLMANVPTYMMFDDHDVTDDWNLEKKTKVALAKEGSFGRRLTANALAAYWGCQGWGNDPDSFDSSFVNALSQFYGSLDYRKADAAEKALHSHYWGYIVPGSPAMIALDTRTDRDFSNPDAEGPALMSKRRLEWLQQSLRSLSGLSSGKPPAQTLLILSPAPVLGFEPIEEIQQRFVKLVPILRTVVDAEYWNADPIACKQFKDLFEQHTTFPNVIFLSGDVHYGYCILQKFGNDRPNVAPRFFQLTSSAVCNHLSSKMQDFFNKLTAKQVEQKVLYLTPVEDSTKIANLDNNIGALWLEDGFPDKQVLHCFNDVFEDYIWTFNLQSPSLA